MKACKHASPVRQQAVGVEASHVTAAVKAVQTQGSKIKMKWDGKRSTGSGTTTSTSAKVAEPSKSTSDQAKLVKKRKRKLQPDGQPKKRKKKRSKLNGTASLPISPGSTGCEPTLMIASAPPCSPPAIISTPEVPGGGNGVSGQHPNDPQHSDLIELQPLVSKAMDGDAEALDQLRELMTDHPKIWQTYGDAGMLGLVAIVQRMGGGNEFSHEVLRRHVDSLWRELEGDHPTGLLRVSLQAVIAASLEMAYLNMHFPLPSSEWSVQQHMLLLRRRDSAQRRFASAVKTYLMVKTLQPSLGPTPSQEAPRQAGSQGETRENLSLDVLRTSSPAETGGNGRTSADKTPLQPVPGSGVNRLELFALPDPPNTGGNGHQGNGHQGNGKHTPSQGGVPTKGKSSTKGTPRIDQNRFGGLRSRGATERNRMFHLLDLTE